MANVLVAGKIHDDGLDLLRRHPELKVRIIEEVSVESYAPHLPEADALILRTQPLTCDLIARAGRLKIVARHGVGYDAVDFDALTARGIPLAIVGDINSSSVAEHTLFLTMATARRVHAYDRAVRTGQWQYRDTLAGTELQGKTFLIIGFGRIGRRVAPLAKAFGMKISVFDPFLSREEIEARGVMPVASLEEGLRRGDVISIHSPYVGAQPLIGRKELALMKRSSILINTARGGHVDETALAEALGKGHLAGAGLDVFKEEPPAIDHPLFALDNVVLSPHSAGLTRECASRMARQAAQNVIEGLFGKLDPALVVSGRAAPVAGVPRPD